MRNRSRIVEIMDNPALDPESHSNALRGLGRINRFSRSVPYLFQPILEFSRTGRNQQTAKTLLIDKNTQAAKNFQTDKDRPLRILDLACGGGDVALGLARRAKAANLPWEIHGADISDHSVGFATEQARAERLNARFFKLDAVNDPIASDYDVIMCTLFLHHLSEDDGSKLVRNMAGAARGLVLIDDLIRSRLGFAIAWAGCRILSRSPVVHHDGPASVKSAFTIAEAQTLAQNNGLANATIKRHWPERFLLAWSPQ